MGWSFLFSSGEGVERRCRAKSRPDRLSGFFGDRFDELYLEGMQIGCNGAVGSSYNFAAPIYHRVLDALSSGNTNEAAQWQARAAKSIEVITSFGYLPAAKKIMQWIGVDCGPARPPLANPSGQKLDSADFFEWIDECKTA